MFTLLAYTLINEVRNLGWNQRVLNLLILSVWENTQMPGCAHKHMHLLGSSISHPPAVFLTLWLLYTVTACILLHSVSHELKKETQNHLCEIQMNYFVSCAVILCFVMASVHFISCYWKHMAVLLMWVLSEVYLFFSTLPINSYLNK